MKLMIAKTIVILSKINVQFYSSILCFLILKCLCFNTSSLFTSQLFVFIVDSLDIMLLSFSIYYKIWENPGFKDTDELTTTYLKNKWVAWMLILFLMISKNDPIAHRCPKQSGTIWGLHLELLKDCAFFGKSNSQRARNKIMPSIITTDTNNSLNKTLYLQLRLWICFKCLTFIWNVGS